MKSQIFLVISIILLFISGCVKEELTLTPTGKVITTNTITKSTEVGTGWSSNGNPAQAVKEASDMALQGKVDTTPDFAIVFASSGSDLNTILLELRKIFGNETKIHGGTSDSRAVMTDKGFVKVTSTGYVDQALIRGVKGLALMTITSKDLVFGVGSADFSANISIQDGSKEAITKAIHNAGKTTDQLPQIILVTPTYGIEEEVIEGIENVVGKETIILGGTTGGPTHEVFGENKILNHGVSLAVIYTKLQIGWAFEGGFDTKDPHSGIVTKVDGQSIVEIDKRPALDVYNEWLDGKIDTLHKEIKDPSAIRDLLTLNPLYRKYTSTTGQDYYLFSHPWPKDDTLVEKSVSTSTKIKVGEHIYLSYGTWETLVNRIGNMPKNAKMKGGIPLNAKPLFGIGIVCGGVLGTIPDDEREKLPVLINYANSYAPFIATFTWGEQGHFPGVGNKHGNLLTSFLVIGSQE